MVVVVVAVVAAVVVVGGGVGVGGGGVVRHLSTKCGYFAFILEPFPKEFLCYIVFLWISIFLFLLLAGRVGERDSFRCMLDGDK